MSALIVGWALLTKYSAPAEARGALSGPASYRGVVIVGASL